MVSNFSSSASSARICSCRRVFSAIIPCIDLSSCCMHQCIQVQATSLPPLSMQHACSIASMHFVPGPTLMSRVMKRGSLRISCFILSSDSADTSISPVSCCLPEGPDCSAIAVTLSCAQRTGSLKQSASHHCPWCLCSQASATVHGRMLQVPHLNETLEARQGPALLSRGSSCVAWLSDLQGAWDVLFSWALRVRPSEKSRFRRWLAAAVLPQPWHHRVAARAKSSGRPDQCSSGLQRPASPAAAPWTRDTKLMLC